MSNPNFQLYFDVLHTLEHLQTPYVIIGAFAGTSYGVTRVTLDVDIVVDLTEAHIQALAAAFPPPRFYADPDQMRDSIRLGILFNIIDTAQARKVDLIPLTMKPGYDFALARRIRREIPLTAEQTFLAWFAQPEDIIVGKLMAWQEGQSYKHEADIRDILTAVKLGDDAELSASFDVAYINRWTTRLAPPTAQLWDSLKQQVDFEE